MGVKEIEHLVNLLVFNQQIKDGVMFLADTNERLSKVKPLPDILRERDLNNSGPSIQLFSSLFDQSVRPCCF